nr:MAG TPA: hypothetical protein [Caudoviricetes sp.]
MNIGHLCMSLPLHSSLDVRWSSLQVKTVLVHSH